MPTKKSPNDISAFVLLMVIIRVTIIIFIWLGLFIAMFVGVFTIPVLMVGGLTLVLALFDVGMFVKVDRYQHGREAEKELMKTLQDPDQEEDDQAP
jgi:membrane protein implicated in regulation of membrane protease activity